MSDGIPVCCAEYNGNINDFTNFPSVLKSVKGYGLKDRFLIVMDGGFAVDSNIDMTDLLGYDFLMGAPIGFCSGIRKLLLDWRESAQAEENVVEINDEPIRAHETVYTYGERKVRVLMYKAPSRSSDEECALTRMKRLMDESLAGLQGKMTKAKARQYEDLYDIEVNDDGTFECKLNEVGYRERFELCGCFALLTNREGLSLQEALTVYREKDVVEKNFAMLKNDILHERLQVAQLESLQGKIFLAFVGLILRRTFSNRLKEWIQSKRLSLNAALEMLCDIECRKSGSQWLLTKAFTAQQKDLIKRLNIPVNYLGKA